MISGKAERRRKALAWSTLVSLVLTPLAWVLLFYVAAHAFVPKQGQEKVAEKQIITLDKRLPTPAPTPEPTPQPAVHQKPVPPPPAAAAEPARHELAKDVPQATPQPPSPPPHRNTVESRIAADQKAFSNEVAQLNAANGAKAIPTIDPATQESATKSYSFSVPSGMHSASAGNGIITTTRSWHEHGEDCYYGRYEYTYPNGSNESASIAWPFCYDPGSDPFLQGLHLIPFPLPLPGYRTDPTELPPMERDVYQHWLSGGGDGV